MPRRNEDARGFSLIEAVIVIAIMAILASAATPMLMRSLTQQRTHKTRDLVRGAYEALVGARDRNLPNLMADVGFVPPNQFNDLRILTTLNPAGGWPGGGPPPPRHPSPATGFTWGWNGPYWTSPLQSQAGTNGLPADAWGRSLRWQANQVQSAGADGVFGTTDDVAYPPSPANPPAAARLHVTLLRDIQAGTGPVTVPVPSVTFTSVDATDRYRQQQPARVRPVPPLPPLSYPLTYLGSDSQVLGPLDVQPGPVFVQVKSSLGNQSQTITLSPGETRYVLFRFNF